MHMSNESILVIIIVGLIAGWLAGQIAWGTGFGIIGDLLIGIVGAFIGNWLFAQLGIHIGTGIIAAIISAGIGARIEHVPAGYRLKPDAPRVAVGRKLIDKQFCAEIGGDEIGDAAHDQHAHLRIER